MTSIEHFADTYAEARARFRAAAETAGAELTAVEHPLSGSAEPGLAAYGIEELCTDVAVLGDEDAEAALFMIAGTHGIEGYCGSGALSGWLAEHAASLPGGVRVTLLHGHNPYGFAMGRRVNEDNIDLNRNYVDHFRRYPANAGYEELHHAICPHDWTDTVLEETEAILDAYAEKHGEFALQGAVSGGQYTHNDGLFFGGHAPAWSQINLRRLMRAAARGRTRFAVIDWHTGLGPRGHGELICTHKPGTPEFERAQGWYGDITSPSGGTSTSADIKGDCLVVPEQEAPEGCEVTGIAVEFGTHPVRRVLHSLRGDNWLHRHGDLVSELGRELKAETRECFYPDGDDWKRDVRIRSDEVIAQALAGLTGG
jgi:hypothetical protein